MTNTWADTELLAACLAGLERKAETSPAFGPLEAMRLDDLRGRWDVAKREAGPTNARRMNAILRNARNEASA